MIIGGGPSYWDIALRIAPKVKGNLIVATRKPLSPMSSANQKNVSEVTSLCPMFRSATFTAAADAPEYNIDTIILCTGYRYDYPYLQNMETSEDGSRLPDVWNQMIWIGDRVREPTLAFVGLPKMSSIFTIVEAQSAYIARVFSGRLFLPSKPLMVSEIEEEMGKRQRALALSGPTNLGFHNFNYPRDKCYINKLTEKCRAADRSHSGKTPPDFDDYLDWTRDNVGKMRTAFIKKGKEKHNFTTPESLGFSYNFRGHKRPHSVFLKH